MSTPVIGEDGTIDAGSSNGKFYAINPDGTQKWVFKADSVGRMSSPAIGIIGAIYVGAIAPNSQEIDWFYEIDLDGTLKWELENASSTSTSELTVSFIRHPIMMIHPAQFTAAQED